MKTSPASIIIASVMALALGTVAMAQTPAVTVTAGPTGATVGVSGGTGVPAVTVSVVPPSATVTVSPSVPKVTTVGVAPTALVGADAGETRIALDVGDGIRFVAPSRVTVPAGERLTVVAPFGAEASVVWMKDGQPIAGQSKGTLVLATVAAGDAGVYQAVENSPFSATGRGSQELRLAVGPMQRLLNISSRTYYNPVNGPVIVGFVVSADPGSRTASKTVLLRVIGPTLRASFGMTDAVAKTKMELFDESGKRYEGQFVFPAVVGGPTLESMIQEATNKVGAFPLANGGDSIDLRPLAPGPYTLRASSADGTAGSLLIEIYEVP